MVFDDDLLRVDTLLGGVFTSGQATGSIEEST